MSAIEPCGEERPVARIAALMHGHSLEATLPTTAEIDALTAVIEPGTAIYLSLPPRHAAERLIAAARDVWSAGFLPVPHLPARAFESEAHADTVVAKLVDAGVARALVIAGDRDTPAGPCANAVALIRSGIFERRGLTEIGIAAYPDGHPKIADNVLATALTEKLDEAFLHGLSVHVVTQFCFDPDQILSWLRRFRYARIDVPVRIGIAGPTTLRSLMRYAIRCGVRASLQRLLSREPQQLLGEVAPDAIVKTLSDAKALRNLEPLAVHFFSFGGLLHTARWAQTAARGRWLK